MTVPSTARRRPAGRYDPPSLVGQRVLAVLLTVLMIAFVAAAARFLWSRWDTERLQGSVVTYDVRSDREVEMDLEVVKPAGARAWCIVRARDRTGLEVGRDVVAVDPEGTPSDRASATFVLRTSARAITAEIAACTSEPVPRPTTAP